MVEEYEVICEHCGRVAYFGTNKRDASKFSRCCVKEKAVRFENRQINFEEGTDLVYTKILEHTNLTLDKLYDIVSDKINNREQLKRFVIALENRGKIKQKKCLKTLKILLVK